ncbi:MAG: type II secretion protein ATPase [Alphaproteobacteria bacterium]|nr:MAG: type II secretion protein ATPase [Alphaproteobacteria bacterium]
MSEIENQATDTLLPSASILVFSKDSDTLDSAKALLDDWRFARVNVNAIEGGVEEAITTFESEGATEIIIIQTDEIDDSFTERLGELSNYCDEGTAAIIIGPVNDVYLYRQLIEMGVSDYLVRPIKVEILKDVIAKALIQRLGVSDSRLIAFVGAKGGVGTSSMAQICAWLAADNMENKTLLIDAAGGWSPLSVGIGFDPSASLPEIARAVEAQNEDALERMFFEASDKLTILASGSDAMLDPSVSAAQYEAVLDNLMVKSPVVMVDLSGAESSVKKAVLSRAHEIIMVATPTVTSLRFCRSLLKEISDIRGGETGGVSLVVNQAGLAKTYEVSLSDIGEALEFPPSACVPYVPSVFLKYESDIKGVITDKDASVFIGELASMLQKSISNNVSTTDQPEESSGFLGGLFSRKKSK